MEKKEKSTDIHIREKEREEQVAYPAMQMLDVKSIFIYIVFVEARVHIFYSFGFVKYIYIFFLISEPSCNKDGIMQVISECSGYMRDYILPNIIEYSEDTQRSAACK